MTEDSSDDSDKEALLVRLNHGITPYHGTFAFLLSAAVNEAARGRIILDEASGTYTLHPDVKVGLDPASEVVLAAMASEADGLRRQDEDAARRQAGAAAVDAAEGKRRERAKAIKAAAAAAAPAGSAAPTRSKRVPRAAPGQENKPLAQASASRPSSKGKPVAPSVAALKDSAAKGVATGTLFDFFKTASAAAGKCSSGAKPGASKRDDGGIGGVHGGTSGGGGNFQTTASVASVGRSAKRRRESGSGDQDMADSAPAAGDAAAAAGANAGCGGAEAEALLPAASPLPLVPASGGGSAPEGTAADGHGAAMDYEDEDQAAGASRSCRSTGGDGG